MAARARTARTTRIALPSPGRPSRVPPWRILRRAHRLAVVVSADRAEATDAGNRGAALLERHEIAALAAAAPLAAPHRTPLVGVGPRGIEGRTDRQEGQRRHEDPH